MVEGHGWKIVASSEGVGKGTVITVEIPLKKAALVISAPNSRRPSSSFRSRANRMSELHRSRSNLCSPSKIHSMRSSVHSIRSNRSSILSSVRSSNSSLQSIPVLHTASDALLAAPLLNAKDAVAALTVAAIPGSAAPSPRVASTVLPLSTHFNKSKRWGHSRTAPRLNDCLLVVDDASVNRKMMVRMLTKWYPYCREACDGIEAVEQMKAALSGEENVLAVLMDYQMPHMDGPTATHIIREMGYKGPIVGVTGNALPQDIETFIDHGANKVFLKPFDLVDFQQFMKGADVMLSALFCNNAGTVSSLPLKPFVAWLRAVCCRSRCFVM